VHEHNHGSYLGNLDEAFTWISRQVIQQGVMSVVSYNPAEICHHLERRLVSPQSILDAKNLAPVTGREHTYIHSGGILVHATKDGRIAVVDLYGARFVADTTEFQRIWQKYLDLWWCSKRGPTSQSQSSSPGTVV